jgi:hypothetical protein
MEEDRYKSIDNEIFPAPQSVTSTIDMNEPSDEKKAIEETSAEIATPQYYNGMRETKLDTHHDRTSGVGYGGTLVGTIALIVSILSLFMMPFLLGIIGIIGGFISRSKGAKSLGSWAIGIGAVSIIVGIFISPFF